MGSPKILIYSKSMSGSRMHYNGICRPDTLRREFSDYGDVYFYNELDYGKISQGDIALLDFFDPNDPDLSIWGNPSRISRLKNANPSLRIITTSGKNEIAPILYYMAGANLVLKSSSLCPLADTLSKGYQSGKNYPDLEIGIGGLGYQEPHQQKGYYESLVERANKDKRSQQDIDGIVELLINVIDDPKSFSIIENHINN